MIIKSKIKPENRRQLLTALGPLAWLAITLSIFLGRMENPDLDFINGFLLGFSIVGNLAYIYVTTRYLKENRRQ
jgi:hypothetical protein